MPLFIVAAVVCMYGLRELEPLISGQDQPLLTLALVGLQIVLVSLAALLMGRRALARLEQDSKQQGPLGGIYRRLSLVMNILLLAMFAGDIYLAGWADLATAAVQRVPVLLDELLILLPLLISWAIVQSLLYGLDRAVRLRAWQSMPVREVWSRRRYLLFHIQAGILPVLIPLGLLMGLIDSLELIEAHLPVGRTSDSLTVAIMALGVGLIVLFTPVLIRLVWAAKALRTEPIRQRLENICRSGKLRYGEIVLWRTANTVANAAVMGFWGPLRYLVVTDALLKEMSQEEVEAVFAHEVGHIGSHHLPYYVLFMVGLNLIIYDCLELSVDHLKLFQDGSTATVLQFTLLAVAFLGLFGWISRRFERDADVWAIEHTGCPDGHCQPGCPLYDLRRAEEGEQPQGPPRDRLCPLAVRCFTEALQRIAFLNAIPQRARSWRHSSIGSRVNLLYRLSSAPGELARFRRIIRLIKIVIWVSVLGGAAGAILLQWWGGKS